MRFAPRVAATVALVSMLSAPTSWQFAASAQGDSTASPEAVKTTTTDTITTTTTGGSTTTSDTTTTVKTTAEAPPATPLISELDQRSSQLEARIANALAEGRLNATEADNFRAILGRVSEEEAEYLALAGKLGPATTLRLQLVLDGVDKVLSTSLHDRRIASFDLPARQAAMEARIDAAESDGRLNPAEAQQLKAQLKLIRDDATSRSSGGKLTYTDALVVSMVLDGLDNRLGHILDLRPIPAPDVVALKTQLSTLEKNYKADQSNVDLASRRLNHTVDVEALKKVLSQKVLSAGAALTAASTLEWIETAINLNAAGKPVAVDLTNLQDEVDRHIALALVTGRLTPAEAHDLRAELEGIVSERSTMGDATQKLSAEQQTRLALEFQRLSGRLARAEHAPTAYWTGLDTFQANLDHHISDGLAAERLSQADVDILKKVANDIAAAETEYLKSNSSFDTREGLDLAIQAQQLNVRLHHALKDRTLTVPDIAVLQADLEKTISEGIEFGKLRYTGRLQDTLTAITQLKDTYAKTPTGLDDRAKLAIAQEIEHTLGEILTRMHNDPRPQIALDLRLNNLYKMTYSSLATGVLSAERAAQYKSALDTIYGDLNSSRKSDNILTAGESLRLSSDLQLIQQQLDEELRDVATLPSQLMPRYRNVALHIGKNLANGRLTTDEANALTADLDQNAQRLAEGAAAQGGLSHGEGLRLAYDLEVLENKLESLLKDEPVAIVDVTQRAIQIDNNMANALAAGKLTITQAQHMRTQFDQILGSSAAMRKSDLVLTYPESIALTVELDRFNRNLGGAIQQASGQDLTSRRASLEKAVKAAAVSGKLQAKDAQAFNLDLDSIAESEAAFRTSDEGLTFAEAMTLALDLDRLASRLDSVSKGQVSLRDKQ